MLFRRAMLDNRRTRGDAVLPIVGRRPPEPIVSLFEPEYDGILVASKTRRSSAGLDATEPGSLRIDCGLEAS